VAALEDRLAYQIHELEDGNASATASDPSTAAPPANQRGNASGLELPSDSDDEDIVAFTP